MQTGLREQIIESLEKEFKTAKYEREEFNDTYRYNMLSTNIWLMFISVQSLSQLI